MPKPWDLALCVECDEVHGRDLTACPDCGCTSAVPLSRITQRQPETDHLRVVGGNSERRVR